MTVDEDALRHFLEELIPFNKHLGLKLESYNQAESSLLTRLEFRPEFIGNPIRKAPHGGLLSAIIDATAGTAAALSLNDFELVTRLSTIDMRVDYLEPAFGNVLFTRARVMRSGRRVIVVRSEVFDDEGIDTALGTNVFNVSRKRDSGLKLQD